MSLYDAVFPTVIFKRVFKVVHKTLHFVVGESVHFLLELGKGFFARKLRQIRAKRVCRIVLQKHGQILLRRTSRVALARDFLVETNASHARCFPHVFACEKLVIAVFENPARLVARRAFLVVTRKRVLAYIERKFFFRAAFEFCGFCVCDEFSSGFYEHSVRLFDINLHDGFTPALARVFDFCKHSHAAFRLFYASRNGERRVRKSEAERIKHFFLCKGFKVAIADEHVFLIYVVVLESELLRRVQIVIDRNRVG